VTLQIERQFRARGLRLTNQRRLIAEVVSEARGYPDFAELYRRVAERDRRMSRATVYRTLRLLASESIIECHAFRDGRSCFECVRGGHHDHLIDLDTGKIVEFVNPRIERLFKRIARQLGYKLVDHRFELYATLLPPATRSTSTETAYVARSLHSAQRPPPGRLKRHRRPPERID
jgi:Fur family transcriptional regulator, ferric uptake regulator